MTTTPGDPPHETAADPPRARDMESDRTGEKCPVADGTTRSSTAAEENSSDQRTGPPSEATVVTSRPPIGDPALVGRITPSVMGQSLVGTTLGHFRLEEFVGGGGMGAVFRAVDTMLDRTVAVKVLSRSESVDQENVKRFKNEAQSAARLDNENIARVYYVAEDEGWNFIVFEFIEGQNVRDMVAERGPLPLDETISYVVQICDALDHASARDVVHRDIKPSNILVTPQGQAKLVDMGLARLHHVQSGEDDLTASGVTLGTFDYISPEQARDPRSADVRSDLYSLGCSFFYMLTGRPPFPNGTVLQKLLQHSSDVPPDVRQFRGDIPDEIVDVLARLLEKQPRDRYQLPTEVTRQLLQAAESHGIAVPWRNAVGWTLEGPSLRTWTNRLLPWFVPLGLLLVGMLVLDWSLPSGDAESSAPSFVVGDDAYANDPIPDRGGSTWLAPNRTRSGGTEGSDPVPSIVDTATEMAVSKTPTAKDTVPSDVGDRPPPAAPVEEEVPPSRNTESHKTTDVGSPEEPISGTFDGGPPHESATSPVGTVARVASARVPSHRTTVYVVVGSPADLASAGNHIPEDAKVVEDLGGALELASESTAYHDIHLFINGPIDVSPLSIVRGAVTIRAADGYWPVLRFAPQSGDPETLPTSMIQLLGGRLTLERLHLLFDVPDDISPNWALFQLEESRELSLRDCWITVRNENHPYPVRRGEVTVLNVSNSPIPGDAATDGQITRTAINIRNCFVRGKTSFLRARDGAAFDVSLDNCLLAVRDTLVTIEGSRKNREGAIGVTLTLRNATTLFGFALLSVQCDAQAPYPPRVQLRCENAVLVSGTDGILVQQTTDGTSREGPSGEIIADALDITVDRVYYEGIDTFWKQSMVGPDPFSSQTILEMSYPQWSQWWPDGADRPGGQDLLTWATRRDATRRYDDLWPRDFHVSDARRAAPPETPAETDRNAPSIGCSLHDLSPQPYLIPAHE